MAKNGGPRLKVMFLGLRGIGGIQGGVETHVAELVRHLPYDNSEVEVIGRSTYRRQGVPVDPSMPMVRWIPTFRHPLAETIIHSILGVGYAAWRKPDLLHIHAIGPNIVAPLARLMGLRVVSTHHGEDYRREKWGLLARTVLHFGERQAVLSANACISISPVVADSLREKYGKPIAFIPNGVTAMPRVAPGETLAKYGLIAGRYIINVARFVPEKRQMDLVEAFEAAGLPDDVKLVLVGDADHKSKYARRLLEKALEVPGVVIAGHVSGEPLAELFWNAGLFALPSSHEGLPIVLLEAMGCQLPVLVSNLPVYRAMGLPDANILEVADVAAIAQRFRESFAGLVSPVDWSEMLVRYQWSNIAIQTAALYQQVSGNSRLSRRPPKS
jgi:glycosyltransferase involved in cell wall biosynthesis